MQVNLCPPFLHGTKITSRAPGQLEMTVAVRGVFRLSPGAPVAPVTELAAKVLSGDVFGESDDEGRGALVHASDFADFKLKTDLLLRGTCHPGEGRTAQVCVVRFGVGGWSKSLRVLGRRVWTERLGEPISEPAPFASMPITYENAFGGPEYEKNPVGKGYKTAELPTIEDPRALVRSRRDAPDPAGFGPLNPRWPQRSGQLGHDYGKAWKKTRAPFYAADFDWAHFNAAPADQQLDGYLRGDEPLVFEYLHPRAIRFTASLPGLRPRVVCRRTDGLTTEVPMHLDTLLVDLDAERLVLVWRGLAKVTDDQLDDVRTLFLGCEPLAAPRPAEHYLAELDAFEANPVRYQIDQLLPEGAKKSIAEGKVAEGKLRAEADALAKEPPLPEDPAARLEALLARHAKEMPPEQAPQRAALVGQVKSSLQANAGKRAEMKAKSGAVPTREGVEAAMLQGLASAKAVAVAKGMPTDRYEAAEKELARVRERRLASDAQLAAQGKPNPGVQAEIAAAAALNAPDGAAAPPAKEALGPGANLIGRDLSGLDLGGLDLHGALLHDAKLVGTRLAGANLAAADLGGADLTGADLTGADLTQANFTEARAPGAVFDRAKLGRTLFVKTDLTRASLAGALGSMTLFHEAVLTAAKLPGARFRKASFLKANLEGADFSGAELDTCAFLDVLAAGASFEKARLSTTSFLRAKMPGASFVEASGEGCSWQGSTLDGADFRHARLPRAQLNKASLDRAKLFGSDFKGGRFERASLVEASFGEANLMSVSFNKAKLAATDFSFANLYDAKFLGAVAHRKCDFEGANLKLAVWEQP